MLNEKTKDMAAEQVIITLLLFFKLELSICVIIHQSIHFLV
jgi:hypothetical protein